MTGALGTCVRACGPGRLALEFTELRTALDAWSQTGNRGRGTLSAKKRARLDAGMDPLKTGGFVRAPRKGGEVDEQLTEMEVRAALRSAGQGVATSAGACTLIKDCRPAAKACRHLYLRRLMSCSTMLHDGHASPACLPARCVRPRRA